MADKITAFKDKIKCSYYLKVSTEEMLMKIYINRLQKKERPRKSQLIDEAVECLYKTEFGTKEQCVAKKAGSKKKKK